MPTVSISIPSALTVGGAFAASTTVQTSAITGNYALLQVDPSGNVSASPSGTYATAANLGTTGSTLISLITASSAGVATLNSMSGVITIGGAGSVTVIDGSQSITISGSSVGDVTEAELASTGQAAWTAAQNNSLNLSGNLTQTGATLGSKIDSLSGYSASSVNLTNTGATLWQRDLDISGGLEARIFLTGSSANSYASNLIAQTGQAAWLATQNNALNLSGNLTQTGITLFQRDIDISGGLEARIFQSGAASLAAANLVTASTGQQAWTAAQNNAVNLSGSLTSSGQYISSLKVTGSAIVNVPNFTGIGGTQIILSGNSFVLVSGGAGGGSVTQDQIDSLSGWAASSVNLTNTGATLWQRDLDISGALFSQISASAGSVSSLNGISGIITIAGVGNTSVTTAGQTITISGDTGAYILFATASNLTSTGSTLWQRDLDISGGLETRIALSGSTAYSAANTTANNNAINLSGNLSSTGSTFWQRDLDISGGLETRIFLSGATALGAANLITASTGQAAWTSTQNNALNLSGNLTTTGSTLWDRDGSISGGLEARIELSGSTALSAANLITASSGQAAWSAAQNNALNLSGNLTTTGSTLWDRDASISGGLESRIFLSGYTSLNAANLITASTGQQSWSAAQNNALNLSGNLTTTGATLFQRDLDISGALAALIAGGGSVVEVTGSSAIGTANFTGLGGLEVALDGASTITIAPYISVNQVSHGFVAGDVIRSAGTANTYTKALADSAANSEVVGYVMENIADSFKYSAGGLVTGNFVAAAGQVLFLSPTTSGVLTATEPTAAGQISKPLVVVLESGRQGVFMNLRGIAVTAATATTYIINHQTASYTLALSDANNYVQMDMTEANVVTIPPYSGVPFPTGTAVLIEQLGTGQTTVSPFDAGVILRARGGAFKLAGSGAAAAIVLTSGNSWNMVGDITA